MIVEYRIDGKSLLVSGRAARTGMQMYDYGEEYREPGQVFSKASLETWQGAPVTVGHKWIDAKNVNVYAVGYVRSARRDDDHVGVELVIFAAPAIDAIQRRELVEMSAGYTCDVDEEHRQRNIRINHLALGPSGWARCGASCSIAR